MSLPVVLQRCKSLGYRVFEDEWDLNIVALRSSDQTPNTFNDLITVSYKDHDRQWVTYSFQCTTDPGLYWLHNPSRTEGTAVLCPGQYRRSHSIGKHRGQYTALRQCGNVKVFRDPNKDDAMDLDEDTIQEGLFGINVHKAGTNSTLVNRWSAGCVVIQDDGHFKFFMELCKRQIEEHPTWTTFSLTLLEEW